MSSADAAGGQRAGGGRRAEQHAGLAAVDALERLEVDVRPGGEHVFGLAGDEPVEADRVRERTREVLRERGIVAAGEVAERFVQQAERREDRHRLAKRDVRRRPAAAQRRVVHARQIVEHERRRVHGLDRARRRHRARRVCRRDRPPACTSTARTRLEGASSV